jgi:hypothetical protein
MPLAAQRYRWKRRLAWDMKQPAAADLSTWVDDQRSERACGYSIMRSPLIRDPSPM